MLILLGRFALIHSNAERKRPILSTAALLILVEMTSLTSDWCGGTGQTRVGRRKVSRQLRARSGGEHQKGDDGGGGDHPSDVPRFFSSQSILFLRKYLVIKSPSWYYKHRNSKLLYSEVRLEIMLLTLYAVPIYLTRDLYCLDM